MRVIIQRVNEASVDIAGETVGKIRKGFMLLVGVYDSDEEATVSYIAKKIAQMRIFSDADDKLNLNIQQVNGEILSVSQFTLYARTRKGNRPSFIDAAKPDHGKAMYELLNETLRKDYDLPVETGEFGADMQVQLENDGPVTIILDSNE